MGGDFEKVLSYIFQNDIEINMIQCDTEVKSYVLIKQKSELEKMKIQGLGGTALSPGLQYIANDKMLNKNNTVILTDGYCDHLDFTGVKGKVLILSTGTECPTLKNNLSNVKQIIIEKNS
jgi:predicted metal-dependent peptidase